MKPTHQHDCRRCIFVGTLDIEATGEDGAVTNLVGDAYVCPSERSEPTILVRYSDDPPDYSSLAMFSNVYEAFKQRPYTPLARAYAMAKEKGVLVK